jgi:type 1 glutamine amidotransferase
MRYFVAVALVAGLVVPALDAQPKKIVLIAGKKSHGPGAHEYVKSVKLLKVMLDRSPNLKGVRTEIHFNGWPEDPRALDSADTILTISDGQDGDKYSPVPFMTDERMQVLERQMKRGCGFGTLHFSTFTPEKYGPQILEWGGGYFQWQDAAGQRNWYSQIKTVEADVAIAAPDHAIARGLEPFRMKEEFYYKIRFRDSDTRLKPLLRVPALAESPRDNVVAWAVERAGGGRGFGTTMGHAYDHWKHPQFRRFVLNALVWSAGAEVPAGGVESRFYEDAEVDRALVPNPIRTLLVTGDHHPAHKWRETTPAIVEALHNRGPEFAVTATVNPDDLANLEGYDLVVLNYCNWTKPGLSDAAKSGFVNYLARGGGLVVVHFANGAFHHSLPEAPPSDWPEYRKIVARVWDHAKGASGHDPYGPFTVEVTGSHPITKGMPQRFDVVDELYFRQAGDVPITVLATAHSTVTKQDEPMAWVYNYRKARVFQTLLGHSAESLGAWGTMQFIRRGATWAAGR